MKVGRNSSSYKDSSSGRSLGDRGSINLVGSRIWIEGEEALH